MLKATGNFYENGLLEGPESNTMRPGGFFLTDQAVQRCGFPPGARVLDLGCGSGATVERLVSVYQLQAIGLDPSQILLEIGKRRNPDLQLIKGVGEELPFPVSCLDGVFAECTLSVMFDLDQVLQEISRVLKPGGWLVVNDVYARNPEGLIDLQGLNLESCIRRALPKQQLDSILTQYGFNIVNWTDHTNLLKQLMVDLIMQHGSMTNFWLKSAACSIDPDLAQAAIKRVKMGYFQVIARK